MDKSTFEQLYRDMLPGLYRLAQSMLRQTADAQDAAQQAAVSAWLSLERIRPGGERAYFTRIVINECRNIQRQRMRHQHRGRFYVSAQRTVPCVEDYDMKFLKTALFPFTRHCACGKIHFLAVRAKPD